MTPLESPDVRYTADQVRVVRAIAHYERVRAEWAQTVAVRKAADARAAVARISERVSA